MQRLSPVERSSGDEPTTTRAPFSTLIRFPCRSEVTGPDSSRGHRCGSTGGWPLDRQRAIQSRRAVTSASSCFDEQLVRQRLALGGLPRAHILAHHKLARAQRPQNTKAGAVLPDLFQSFLTRWSVLRAAVVVNPPTGDFPVLTDIVNVSPIFNRPHGPEALITVGARQRHAGRQRTRVGLGGGSRARSVGASTDQESDHQRGDAGTSSHAR